MNEEKNLNEELENAEAETIEETVAEEVSAEETAAEEVPAEELTEEEVPVEEVTEETAAETAEEAVEEATEEAVGEMAAENAVEAENAELAAEATEAAEIISADNVIDEKKAVPAAKLAIGAVAVLVIAAIVVLAIIFAPRLFNKYNRAGYVNVSGRTISEVAESAGMSLDDFLDSYGLPSNMPGNTSESAAYYTIPCSKMATMYGMDFATLKSTLELPDTITEETTWGEAEGEARLSVYVGEDNLESFKEQYGLGDEVTGDTQWKEIRNIVDEYNRQQRIDSEKVQKEPEKEPENTEAEATEAPVEAEATATPAE